MCCAGCGHCTNRAAGPHCFSERAQRAARPPPGEAGLAGSASAPRSCLDAHGMHMHAGLLCLHVQPACPAACDAVQTDGFSHKSTACVTLLSSWCWAQDRTAFVRLIGQSALQSLLSAMLAPSLRYVADGLALSWRRQLTAAAHKMYLRGNTFYTVAQLAGMQVSVQLAVACLL